jgi:predicted ester cyclase
MSLEYPSSERENEMTKQLTAAEAKALCVRSIEVMTNGTLAELAEVVHQQATNREAKDEPPACRGVGPAAFLATADWLRAAYEDLRFEIHDVVADGDVVVVHATMSGQQVGPFVAYGADGAPAQAFPPKHKRFAVTQTHWFRVADGMVIEHWANRDDNGQAMQLGWIPPTPGYLIRMLLATRRAKRAHRDSLR